MFVDWDGGRGETIHEQVQVFQSDASPNHRVFFLPHRSSQRHQCKLLQTPP